jgi:hypothetical protein
VDDIGYWALMSEDRKAKRGRRGWRREDGMGWRREDGMEEGG